MKNIGGFILISMVFTTSSYSQTSVDDSALSVGQSSACIDSDGDGYGWNGVATCLMTEAEETTNQEMVDCIDTDGDGWGWDGAESCLVTEEPTGPLIAETTSCVDTDGDGYGWDGAATCLVNADTPTDNSSETIPAFTNLETGLKVDFVKAHWMPSDFIGYDIVCSTHEFDGTVYKFTGDSELYTYDALPITPPFTSTVTIGLRSNIQEAWGLENGTYTGPGGSLSGAQWVEIVVRISQSEGIRSVMNLVSTRIWDSDDKYTQCSTPDVWSAFIPTGISQEYIVGDCDYSGEALNDGWGWNSEALQSCPALQQINYGDSSSLQDSLIAEFSGTIFSESQTATLTLAVPTEVRFSGYHWDIHANFGHVSVVDSAGNGVDDYARIQCLAADTYTVSISRPNTSAINAGSGFLATGARSGRLPYDYALIVSDNGGDCTIGEF